MPLPDVSVVIPSYNYGRFLGQAVESVLAQGDRATQIIVVDDGSTDSTRDVARAYGSRVEYRYQANRGPSAARNRGIEASRGEFVAFLDADDYWLPGKLDQQLALLRERPDVAGCHSAFLVSVDPDRTERVGCYWSRSGYHPSVRELLRDNCVNMSTMVLRRGVFSRVGMCDETLRTSEDWNVWLRVMLEGYRLYYLRDPLVVTRHHSANWHVITPPDTQRERAETMLKSVWGDNRDRIPEVFLGNLASLLHYHHARISFERGERMPFWGHLGASLLLSPRLGIELLGGAALRKWRGWRASRRAAA